jgi:hypothetical protein
MAFYFFPLKQPYHQLNKTLTRISNEIAEVSSAVVELSKIKAAREELKRFSAMNNLALLPINTAAWAWARR